MARKNYLITLLVYLPLVVGGQNPMLFERSGNVVTWNMDHEAENMRQAGFQGRDTALWYTLAFIYAFGPDKVLPLSDSDPDMIRLNGQRQEIYNWFDGEVLKVKAQMLADPALRCVAITNDGYDRCGFRLGPPIVARLSEFGSRITLGDIYTYD